MLHQNILYSNEYNLMIDHAALFYWIPFSFVQDYKNLLPNDLWELKDNLHSLYVQPIGNIAERFHALCVKDSGVLYEDPYIQVFFLHFFSNVL